MIGTTHSGDMIKGSFHFILVIADYVRMGTERQMIHRQFLLHERADVGCFLVFQSVGFTTEVDHVKSMVLVDEMKGYATKMDA